MLGSSFWQGSSVFPAYSSVAEKVSLPLSQGPSRPGPRLLEAQENRALPTTFVGDSKVPEI